MLVPAAHLCVLPRCPSARGGRCWPPGILVGALLLPLLALGYYGDRLDLGADLFATPCCWSAPRPGSVWTAVLGSLLAGTLVSAAIVCSPGRGSSEADETVTVRGPATYAGPGSLGGTESALRR